jgi:hypothetical protein
MPFCCMSARLRPFDPLSAAESVARGSAKERIRGVDISVSTILIPFCVRISR